MFYAPQFYVKIETTIIAVISYDFEQEGGC